MQFPRMVGWASLAVLMLAISPASGLAQVNPGDFITADNAEKVKSLVSPGVYLRVVHGMSMKIEPTERIEWPPPYQEATEKYSPQVRLTPDGRSLQGYVAGEPFPMIDANDPAAGVKVMWNEVFRPISTDDYDLRWFNCESVYWGKNKRFFEILNLQVGHYAGYNEVGRTEVEPLPIDPDFKVSGRYYFALIYPILAPEDARGGGLIRAMFADPDKMDDIWLYEPGTRRVRRVNVSIMDTAGGPQSFDPTHYQGWSGKPEDYDFSFLGEKTMLAAIDIHRGVDLRCPTDGGASHCPDAWEMRHVYVVGARERSDRLSSPLYGKQVIYIDSEADFPMYVDLYDRAGQLFMNYTSWCNYSDRAQPDSQVAIYPFKREFQVGDSKVNLQSGLSTVCYHPSAAAPTPESWFINMGAVNRAWFTTDAMVKAAQGGHAGSGG
ncbi:MAG: DUF1329 domain-containing protein [Candidatus Binataceae bacterium]